MLKQIIVCTQMVPSLRHSFQLQAPSPAFLLGWGEILKLFGFCLYSEIIQLEAKSKMLNPLQVILSLLIIAAGFQLADNRSPAVHTNTTNLQVSGNFPIFDNHSADNFTIFDNHSADNFTIKSLNKRLQENVTECGDGHVTVNSCSGCLSLQERNPPLHCGFCEVSIMVRADCREE